MDGVELIKHEIGTCAHCKEEKDLYRIFCKIEYPENMRSLQEIGLWRMSICEECIHKLLKVLGEFVNPPITIPIPAPKSDSSFVSFSEFYKKQRECEVNIPIPGDNEDLAVIGISWILETLIEYLDQER